MTLDFDEVEPGRLIAAFDASPLAMWAHCTPWELTGQSEFVVCQLLDGLESAEFLIRDGVATHRSATIEAGAVVKAPAVVGPGCWVAAGAYVRGGVWLDEGCVIGPGSELKSSFVFSGTTLAHFNFVGDSVLGSGVNFEAGSVICNTRNERDDKEILVRTGGFLGLTGCSKFGAVVGDRCRIGANAVVAPGAILKSGTVLARSSLFDDELSVP